MEKPLISILVVSYNNQEYLFECLQSVFSQTYPNIEVMVGDDCSDDFDAEALIQWIDANRTPNIQKFVLIQNEINIGTVANIEKLQKKSSGEFLFNIAADDVLYDENVINNMYECTVQSENREVEIVIANTEMRDHELKSIIGSFMSKETIDFVKNASPRDLFAACAYEVILPASFLYSRAALDRVGCLSDSFRLVEDVPTHLRLLSQGIKPLFMEKTPAIKHRDGGISHGNTRQSSKLFLMYYNDIVNLYPYEIEPHLDLLTDGERSRIQTRFKDRVRAYYKIHIPEYYKVNKDNIEEAKRILKLEEQAGRLPQTHDNVNSIISGSKTRMFIKNTAYKLSRKWVVLTVVALSLLSFIASGCITLVGSKLSGFISTIMLISGCFFSIFASGAISVNILLRIRRHMNGW